MIHESSYIDKDTSIGENTNIWHFCHIMSGAVIGSNCNIGQNVFIANGVVIGNNCKIQNNVSLYEGVIIRDNVFIGPSAVFTNVKTPRSDVSRKHCYLQTIVEEGATIGANATIICGNTIGRRSVVAAGSVVTKNVDPFVLVMGCPAVYKSRVCECGNIMWSTKYCKECGRWYDN
jgi:UDP-2-acetamido-3-amino-2,3-dideoxy-glucuronate N-acetyltransferase